MFAELYLTDGTTKIDFLGGNRSGKGITLTRMRLSRPQREPSGAFRQAYGSVMETYELQIVDLTQDSVAGRQQQLDRMLEQAKNYFENNAETNLVWLVARTSTEANTRYAVVYGGVYESYNDTFNQPFHGGNGMTVMDEISLVLERSTWQGNPPLEPECLEVDNTVAWNSNLTTWSSNRTLNNVQSLFTTAAGTVLAGAAAIERTTNSGSSWTSELSPGTANLRFWQFAQEKSGKIWAVAGLTTGSAGATSGLYFSTNEGDTWTQHTNTVDFYSVVYRAHDNTLIFGGNGEIRYIQDGGSLTVLSTSQEGKIKAMAVTPDNAIVLGDEYNTWRIPATAFSALITTSDDIGPFLSVVNVGDYMIMGSATYLSISRDDGVTWDIYWRTWGIDTLYVLENDLVLASQSGTTATYISYDGGFSWVAFATMATSPVRAFTELDDTYLFAGANNTIYRRIGVDAEYQYGPYNPSCDTPVFIANHQLQSNWTHIFVFDSSGASYTSVTPAMVNDNLDNHTDQLAFPSPVGTNDALYVGIQTTVPNAGAFSNLFINLTERNYSLTIAIEYWDGAAWTAFTTSQLRDNTQSLKRSGTLVWHDVALGSTSVNSITAYWIRFRVTATGSLSTLLPKFDNIYIIQQPYIEATNIAGDIPALAQMQLFNMLDDGNGNAPSLPTDRVIVGLRTLSRGERFTAYINLAQSQNPPGISVGVGAEAAFVTDRALAAAGEYVNYSPVTTGSFNSQVSVTFDSDLAKDFTGVYQVFLRYGYSSFIDTVAVRLILENFTNQGQIYFDTVWLTPSFTADFADLAYLGQVSIMPDQYLNSTDKGSGTTLRLQFSSTGSGITYDVACFELILIPADEWIGDFNDNNQLGVAGLERFVDIDSATFPKRTLRATVRERGSELVSGVWNTSTSGVFTLQPAQQQRLWFLICQYNESDESQGSAHTLIHQVKLWHHSRWLGLRGND